LQFCSDFGSSKQPEKHGTHSPRRCPDQLVQLQYKSAVPWLLSGYGFIPSRVNYVYLCPQKYIITLGWYKCHTHYKAMGMALYHPGLMMYLCPQKYIITLGWYKCHTHYKAVVQL